MESKLLSRPMIALVPCIPAIAARILMATADAAVASTNLSLSNSFSSSAGVAFCDWHTVAGPVATRLGMWTFMGSEMSSVGVCQTREDVNGRDTFSGNIHGRVLHWLSRWVGVGTAAGASWGSL